MRISDFAGKSKYLYLDFWVSWCSLCIAEMPTLKKVYEIYKGQGLQVISISLDSREGDWKKGIERIDVPWIHLSDLKGDNSEIKQLYNIIGIPHGVLINEKGEIEVAKANAKVLEIMSKSIF
jgi:Peroxiredoxin